MRSLLFAASVVLCSVSLFAESAAGIRWTAPAGWKAEGPRPMRAATYSIAPASGDSAGAECVVNFFGPGQGGSVEANVERWKGQIQGPDGKPASAKVDKRTISGVPMTIIDAAGSYTGTGGPMMASPKAVPGYRLLGAIVEGPGGNVFFKLTGPAKTIAAQQKNFDQLLASIELEKSK
jgi:hypothetical protein